MKLLIVATGGTIACKTVDNILSLDKSSVCFLIENYKKTNNIDIEYDIISPYFIISENLSSLNMQKLIDCLRCVDTSCYCGIIVLHGTDTLSYTANLLSIALADTLLPIVLVSAAYPITDKKSNAIANFSGAVQFIIKTQVSGVFVSYTNIDEPTKIYLGSRLLPARDIDGRFDSIDGELCVICGNTILINKDAKINYEMIKNRQIDNFIVSHNLCGNFLTIQSSPYTSFRIIEQYYKNYDAIVISAFHSGTVNTDKSSGLLSFVKECLQLGLPIMITPTPSKIGIYESLLPLISEYNTIIMPKGILTGVALAKLSMAIGNLSSCDIKEFVEKTNYFFEKID